MNIFSFQKYWMFATFFTILLLVSLVKCQETNIGASCDNQFNLFLNGNLVLTGNDLYTYYSTRLTLKAGDSLVIEGGNGGSIGALFVEFNDLWEGIDLSTGVSNWTCSIIGDNANFGTPFLFPNATVLRSWALGEITTFPYSLSLNKPTTTKWIFPHVAESGTQRVLCGIVLDFNTSCYDYVYSDPNVCHGHGLCVRHDTCQCLNGYYGIDCSLYNCSNVMFNDSNVCFNRGQCISPDNCSCSSSDYFGTNCEAFNCSENMFNSTFVCSSRGACIAPNMCSCLEGFYGQNCQHFDCNGESFGSLNVCSSHGLCIAPNNCSCRDGYYGTNCEVFDCFGIEGNNSLACSQHGLCISPNNCSCGGGYYGANCGVFDCFGIVGNNSLACSQHGLCISPNNCSCNYGFEGVQCEAYSCYGIPQNSTIVCSGNGTCISHNNCSCRDNHYGIECENYDCFGVHFKDTSVCFGNGQCLTSNTCQCTKGYSGSDCSKIDVCNNELYSNSIVCSNYSETIIEKVKVGVLNGKNISFTSGLVLVLFPSDISSNLETTDSSLKNQSIQIFSSLSSSTSNLVINENPLISSVLSLKLFKDKTNEEISVNSLKEPINIYFNHINVTLSANTSFESLNFTCAYYDENGKTWKADGIDTEWLKIDNISPSVIRFSIVCKTNHLTSFGIIDTTLKKELTKQPNNVPKEADQTASVIAAVVSSIAACCILGIMIALVLFIVGLVIRLKKKKQEKQELIE